MSVPHDRSATRCKHSGGGERWPEPLQGSQGQQCGDTGDAAGFSESSQRSQLVSEFRVFNVTVERF